MKRSGGAIPEISWILRGIELQVGGGGKGGEGRGDRCGAREKREETQETQVDANGSPLFFLLCFPLTALFLQRVQLRSSVNIVRALDRPCSKFELRSRATSYLRRMRRLDPRPAKRRKKAERERAARQRWRTGMSRREEPVQLV